MDSERILLNLKEKFTKEELKVFDQIHRFDSLKLASMGHNDTEGYQIFTPRFIVEDMCAAIGDDIFDSSKNVLEPTSGDGAFTVYIFTKRLEKALQSDNFELNSYKALSTIYSMEMDNEIIEIQRNNILTAVALFIENHHIQVNNLYFEILKCIITKNFMWAMFNSNNPIDGLLLGTEVAYKMPAAEKGNFKSLDMPVWDINNDDITFHMEGVEL